MEEYNYTLECESCDAKMELKVFIEDELPCFCPMCGHDMNEEWTIAD